MFWLKKQKLKLLNSLYFFVLTPRCHRHRQIHISNVIKTSVWLLKSKLWIMLTFWRFLENWCLCCCIWNVSWFHNSVCILPLVVLLMVKSMMLKLKTDFNSCRISIFLPNDILRSAMRKGGFCDKYDIWTKPCKNISSVIFLY